MYTENLSARLLENRRIEFYDSSNEVIFTMISPYMYDSAGELSEDVAVEMVATGRDCYQIRMTPNAQWLADKSRVYPVVIDPQVTTDSARTNIVDNYVLEGSGVQNNNLDRLYIGNRSGGRNRAYIKFATMPTIPEGATIFRATMSLQLTSGASTAYTANAYKVTGGDWASDTITWANKPAASTLLASNISHNSLTKYTFSCLTAVQSWYNGSTTGQTNNYGVMLCYSNASIADYNAVYSADFSTESKRPSIKITYELPAGAINGINYIKYGTLYLTVNNGMIEGRTLTLQSLKSAGPARLRQMWRVEYAAPNYYTIRSVYRPDLALTVTDGRFTVGYLNPATYSGNAPANRRWMITQSSNGHLLRHMGSASQTLYPAGGSPGASVTVGTSTAVWDFEPTTVSNQLLLINTTNGLPATNAVRYAAPGESLSMEDMNFMVVYVTQNSNLTYVDWASSTPTVATVNEDTGYATALREGRTTITATQPNSTNSVSYTLKVRIDSPLLPEYIEYMNQIRITGSNFYGGTTDHSITVIKSQRSTDPYFMATDNINNQVSRCYVVGNNLKNQLNTLEAGFQDGYNIIPGLDTTTNQEQAAHAAKLETDELVEEGYFVTGSTEYYGVWAYNYVSMCNLLDMWTAIIDKTTLAYSVYISISTFFYSMAVTTNTTTAYVTATQYDDLAAYLDDIDDVASGITFSSKQALSAEERNLVLSQQGLTNPPPYKPNTPVIEGKNLGISPQHLCASV